VVSTLESLRVESADLIGASFGGTVAFAVVRLVPARVRSVVVIDSVVSTPEEYLSRRVVERTRTEMLSDLRTSTSKNLPPKLATFAGHVLVLAAGLSDNVTESGRAALQSELGPRFHAVTLADVGHNLIGDALDDTVSEIVQFLDEVDHDRRTSLSDVPRSP
jgi:pimeloyl-ACP methyl ester carboxylesterase